jgi:acetylglutamate kinase
MNSAIAKAAALIEAHRYIQRFRDKIVVVKVGGSIQEDDERMKALLTDVAFMAGVGIRPVLVHGGGKSITRAMDAAGLKANFIQGRRYTDRATLEIAEHVLVNECNKFLVDNLNASGSRAIALHSLGSCVLLADRMTVADPKTGESIDLGYVGTVSQVNTVLLAALCEDGYIPVIAPVAMTRPREGDGPARAGDPDATGKLNVNADTAAGHVAAALKAEKLVVLSDTHGIRIEPDNPGAYASALTHAQIDGLVKSGVIGEGMLPKVEACLLALNAGVPKAHIIDGRIPHSLLLEIYTDEGIGTQITLR